MNNIDLICRALRRLGVLASGQLPTDAEAADALETLKAIILRTVSEGGLGQLAEVVAPEGDYKPEEFTRVLRNDPDTSSITLPDTVVEYGVKRPPFDGSIIAIADVTMAQAVTYIYDGDLGAWLPVETMTLTSIPPLTQRDANGFASMLAVELADEYGQSIPAATELAATRWHSQIVGGWSRQTKPTRPADYF